MGGGDMRKIASLLLIFVLVLGIMGPAFAQLEEKKAQLEKIKKYIVVLDEKIEKARAAKQINKLAQLKDLKRNELERAKVLNTEIAALQRRGPRGRAVGLRRHGFLVGGGYGGGAGIISGGYVFPLAAVNVRAGAGVGIGNSYTVINAGVAGVLPLGRFFTGLELGMANYSKTVTNIPGVSGNINSGTTFGAGIFFGMPLGPVRAQLGYNSALGLTAGANYRF